MLLTCHGRPLRRNNKYSLRVDFGPGAASSILGVDILGSIASSDLTPFRDDNSRWLINKDYLCILIHLTDIVCPLSQQYPVAVRI